MLDRLLANVREGQSAVLVIRGEAGIGKTALLEYAARHASDFRVAQVMGVEAEMELPFAGIQQLCAPVLDQLDALAQPQQDALGVALGRASGDVPDRFLIGLAVLGLLSAVAEERPLLCLVEDAHWLDAASALVLGFVARRLLAESVAIVVAVREPTTRDDFDGLPELLLRGLAEEDAHTLLMRAVPGRLDDRVRDRIIAETRGNPLALLDLPRSMSARSWPAASSFSRRQTFRASSRITISSAPVNCLRQRSGCCCWPRPSRRVTRRSSGARLSGSASKGARSPQQKTRSWSRSEPVSASGIHWCDPRYTGRRSCLSGELCMGRWRRRPIRIPIRPSGVASCSRGGGSRRGGGRRVGALRRPGAGPWGRGGGCGVPGARDGADPRSGGEGQAGTGRRAGKVRRCRTGGGARVAGDR